MHKARRRLGISSAIALIVLSCPFPAGAAKAAPADPEVVVTAQSRPDLFGTIAIPGPAGRWSDKWHKVMGGGDQSSELRAFVAPARGLGRLDQLHYLQDASDRRIGWRSDGTQYGARTYWASAAETLASNLGDDDDRAILKYQALRALGFPRSDFFLVMGRDRVRGDYVLLAARAGGRWWLLEEQGNRPVPAEGRLGFEPIASFGAGKSWVHGRARRIAATPASSLMTASGSATAR